MSEELHTSITPHPTNETEGDFPEIAVKKCLNCGEILTGKYCLACGQKDINLQRPFWVLLSDTMGDLFSFDSRFFGTLFPLFFRPGYITRAYNRGRRMRYVPPFRLYLVISVIFFLLLVTMDIQLFDTSQIKINQQSDGQQTVGQLLSDVTQDMTNKRDKNLAKNLAKNPQNNPENQQQIYDTTIRLMEGLNKVWHNPKLLNVVIADWIPRMMFLMLPLYALILKLAYIRRKRYYSEHLVFSLHFHAFLFLLSSLLLILYHFAPLIRPSLPYLLWYMPIYFFIALWVVYDQGLIKSFFKGLFISFIYLIFLYAGLLFAMGYGLSKV